jgi:hypothetical protein
MEASPADDATERDTADDWRIEPRRRVATVAELEGRIDVAIATARTAEEAALEIGAASREAAEQARRAAALAESASAAAARAASEVAAAQVLVARRPAPPVEPPARTATAPAVTAPPVEPPAPAAASAEPVAAVTPTEPQPVAPATPSEPQPIAAARPASLPDRSQPDLFDERLTAFRERAESVMIRLQKLEAGMSPGDGPTEVVRLH